MLADQALRTGSDIRMGVEAINKPTRMGRYMRIHTRLGFLPVVLALFFGAVLLSPLGRAQEPRLIMRDLMPAWGGACHPGGSVVVAGSSFFISVENTSDKRMEPLKKGWPEGYVLEAALDLSQDQAFRITDNLIIRLEATPYWSSINRAQQYRLRSGEGTVDAKRLNLKEFVLHIPNDLAGHTLTLRASYRGRGQDLVANPSRPYQIVAPCNREDSARVIATRIFEGVMTLNYASSIRLADSMLTVNMTDPAAWTWAEAAARGSAQFDKAITYLDRLYDDFGVVSMDLGDADHPPQLHPRALRDPESQQAYERVRDALLQAKAEHEQQQH
jgi:hypothetical protein